MLHWAAMGYRDDELAFARRRDLLHEEVGGLSTLRDGLMLRQQSLRDELRKARLKLGVMKALRWAARHPVLTAFMLLIVGLSAGLAMDSWRQGRARQRQIAAVLGSGCKTQLLMRIPPRARAYLNGIRLDGATFRRRICPGRYQLRIVRRDAIPWQRRLVVQQQEKIEVQPALIPWRQRPRGAVVIQSVPEGALVFVDGREEGLTPLLVQPAAKGVAGLGRAVMQIGLWAPSRVARQLRIRVAPEVWFHLPATTPEVGEGQVP